MTTWKDIKDQPIYILALTIVASVGATAAIYEKFLVPARDPNAIQRATILQSQLDTAQRLIAEIQPLQQRLQKAEAELASKTTEFGVKIAEAERKAEEAEAKAESRALAAEWANTFSIGSPYPVGMEKVRIGDSTEKLATAYPDRPIDRSKDGIQVVSTGHSVFERVVYYSGRDAEKDRITHIVFWSPTLTQRHDEDDWLATRLTVALGQPKSWGAGYYSWEPEGLPGAFIRPPSVFMVMKAGSKPNLWPGSPIPSWPGSAKQ